MLVRVLVIPEGAAPPHAGAPVRVELRDTSLADAPATVVAANDTVLEETPAGLLAVAEIDLDDATLRRAADLTLWARIRLGGGERTVPGDWVTMASVPLPRAATTVVVPVRRVG